MTKRLLSQAPNPMRVSTPLDFKTWKAQRPKDQAGQRDDGHVYDSSIEDFPDQLWYTLNLDRLGEKLLHMCNELGRSIATYKIVDEEIADLRRTLMHAKLIPRPKRINIAVVGNQGMGKSSITNALMNRHLVEVMGGSEACTAFATIIEHKEGAPDDTDLSDVKVTLLSLDEIHEFVEEQIRRYADFLALPAFGDEDVDSGSEDSDSLRTMRSGVRDRRVSEKVQQGADTAKEFFGIMFNTSDVDDSGAEAELELQRWLEEPDLEDGRFLEHLVKLAKVHLANYQGTERGDAEYPDIPDVHLAYFRSWAVNMWPLVKSVTISTGSILLRQGICLIDLPGYGDLDQTRTAVVNQFRRMANFEIIVANSERYLTKTDEDRYLMRAIRHHGPKNVFLVLNKIDRFLQLDVDEIRVKLKRREFKVDPFLSVDRCLASALRLENENPELVEDYQPYLIKQAQMAFSQYECDKIAQKLQKKGIRAFSTCASRYREWLNPNRLKEPPYEPEETGIPSLRQALLELPAAANYENLSSHVIEVLTDIEDRVSRILEKFTDDDGITEIRRHLLDIIPGLDRALRNVAYIEPGQLVLKAWNHTNRDSIAAGVQTVIKAYSNNTWYQTFSLMLRNNGYAVGSLKYSHRNLNSDVLDVYKSQIKACRDTTLPKAKEFCESLIELVQAPLKGIERILDETPGDLILKGRAQDELKKLIRRLGIAQGRVLSRLEGAVHENYRHFTTEDDTKCPIATELKAAYMRIHDLRKGERRRVGIYAQQRNELIYAINNPDGRKGALIDVIPAQVKTRQCGKWQAISEDFTTDVLARYKDFVRIMQDLLENDIYMSDEHKMIRKRLSKQLPKFRQSFGEVTAMFSGAGAQPTAKRTRRNASGSSPALDRFSEFGSSQF